MISPHNQYLNTEIIELKLRSLDSKNTTKNAILLDGDRTLTPHDTGYLFGDLLGVKHQVKSIFESAGYSFSSFLRVQEIYGNLPLDSFNTCSIQVARKANLYPGIVEFIRSCMPIAMVIIVTSSLQEVWENILSVNQLNVPVIGMNHPQISPQIVGKEEKQFVAYWLKSLGYRVVSLGDSELDVGMLIHADLPIIVVNHRNNKDLLPLLEKRKSCIRQISFLYPSHEGIVSTSLVEILDYLRS
jgi:phosphoserine phosphatase